ncbi:MAG: heme exporter protein CcmD [Betaproteobacteria bacterium]
MSGSSWSDFVAMGGYGLYVWGSFAMCGAVLALELGLLVLRRRSLRGDIEEGVDNPDAGAQA